jgi:hypothetical protein
LSPAKLTSYYVSNTNVVCADAVAASAHGPLQLAAAAQVAQNGFFQRTLVTSATRSRKRAIEHAAQITSFALQQIGAISDKTMIDVQRTRASFGAEQRSRSLQSDWANASLCR